MLKTLSKYLYTMTLTQEKILANYQEALKNLSDKEKALQVAQEKYRTALGAFNESLLKVPAKAKKEETETEEQAE